MRFKFLIRNNVIYIYRQEKFIKEIPAYVLKILGDEYVFGKLAFDSISIYLDRVFSLNELLINSEIQNIIKLIDYLKKSIVYIGFDEKKDQVIFDLAIIQNNILNFAIKSVFNENVKFESSINCELPYYMKNGEYHLQFKEKNGLNIVVNKEIYVAIINVMSEYMVSKIPVEEITQRSVLQFKRFVLNKIQWIEKELIQNKEVNIKYKYIELNNKVRRINLNVTYDEICSIPEIRLLLGITRKNENEIYKKIAFKINEGYRVVAVSPFSYGKSTILNSLIGTDFLKMDVRAETAVITKVTSVDYKKCIYFVDKEGKCKEVVYKTKDDIRKILSNSTGARDINDQFKEIKVVYPIKGLKNVTFIDSPGLFSRYEEHNQLSEQALKQGDLILFIVDPSKIGDKNFTNKLSEYINYFNENNKEFCFVISKLDLCEEYEDSVLKEMNIVLKEMKLEHIPVFFVSGYFALKGRQLKNKEITLEKVRKSRDIFVIEDEEILRGKAIEQRHCEDLIKFSRIEQLIDFIKRRKER